VGIPAFLFVLGLPAASVAGYLGALAWIARPKDKVPLVQRDTEAQPFLTFVVPAHDEASGIERTVESLLAVDYPRDRYSVCVVADNCSDNTKDLAERAGARVIERFDTNRRGKGYALEVAFQTLIAEGQTDGIVVVDADSTVSSNLLSAMAARLLDGEGAIQAHYGVRNVDDSWRTRLMDLAFTLYHGVRSNARERLSLSTGLRGNGMGFAVSTLRRVPYRSFSLVEDVEYGIELGLHGVRVAYAHEATVLGEMVSGDKTSESQRKRWEQGRSGLLRRYLPTLLARAVRERNLVLFDLMLDLLTPPLTRVTAYTGLGTIVGSGLLVVGLTSPVSLVPWYVASASLVLYVGRGVQMSTHGLRTLVDLAFIPRYVLWKLRLRLRSGNKQPSEWVRTTRSNT
jgi:1,2-diacylglycerol 3-beta-glucosyltransferase